MKTHETCSICGEINTTKNGSATRHLRTHGLLNITEYYYSFNDQDLCLICGTRNKAIISWNFKKAETCGCKECTSKIKSIKASAAQKRLALENRHNYQNKENIEKGKLISAQKRADGTHKSLTPENIKIKSDSMKRRNEINGNPMKNPLIAAKVAKSKTGTKQSKSHKENISKGLKAFLTSLSDEEFTKRMKNTFKIKYTDNVDVDYKKLDLLHIFENIDFYIKRTDEIIDIAKQFCSQRGIEFLVLNENDIGIK